MSREPMQQDNPHWIDEQRTQQAYKEFAKAITDLRMASVIAIAVGCLSIVALVTLIIIQTH